MAYTINFGSSGLDVKKAQYYLNQVLYTPGTQPLVEDGVFGQKTQFAVVVFQYLNNLSIDGVLGSRTWDVLIQKFKELDTPNPEVNKTGYTLRIGSVGLGVQKIQMYLNRLNVPSPNLTVDGNYGQRTANAVRIFQAASGLSADGVVGNNTWDKIIQAL